MGNHCLLSRANEAIEKALHEGHTAEQQLDVHKKLKYKLLKSGHAHVLPLRFQKTYLALKMNLSRESFEAKQRNICL